jgi:hypothetical protein
MGEVPLNYARSAVRVGPRLSKLTLLAPCFPFTAITLIVFYYRMHLGLWIKALSVQTLWWIVVALFGCGAVTGIIAIYRCNRSQGRLEGDVFAYIAVIISTLLGCPAILLAKLAAHTWWSSPG